MVEINLRSKWVLFCQDKLLLSHDRGEKIWSVIQSKYGEPIRKYHTLEHIQDLLIELQVYQNKIVDLNAVILAIFFHDIIYDPTARDNEEKSAELFSALMSENLSDVIVEKVVFYINSTRDHSPALSKDEDLLYFLDLDMSILGRDRLAYAQYSKKIRMEYCHIQEVAFNSGRSTFLRKILLDEKTIFLTEDFRSKMEQKARENIAWEIEELERNDSLS